MNNEPQDDDARERNESVKKCDDRGPCLRVFFRYVLPVVADLAREVNESEDLEGKQGEVEELEPKGL